MLSIITTIILFLLIISLIVVVHEFGHYIAARITGMEIEEFAVGMGPVLWQRKHSKSKVIARFLDFVVRLLSRGAYGGSSSKNGKPRIDTAYMIKLFPIGGYVRILGEEEENLSEGSFSEKSVRARILVAVAGVFMNILLGAFFFYLVLFAKGFVYDGLPYYEGFKPFFGEQEIKYAYPVTVMNAVEDSPAKDAGFEGGWEILTVDGVMVENTQELRNELEGKENQEITIGVNTPEEGEMDVLVTVSDEATIGVELAQDLQVLSISYTGVQKIFAGFLHGANMLKANVYILGQLIGQSVEEGSVDPVAQSVAGPVGLVAIIDIVKKYGGIVGLLDLIGLFNVALVMMNMLPFPALDGGHVAFLALEGIRGRPVNKKLQQALFTGGMIILLLFMVVVSAKDVFQFGIWDGIKGLFGG